MKTLIVEGDLMSQCVLAKLLSERGHEVTCFENAEQAILAHQREAYPLVFVDGELPGMRRPAALPLAAIAAGRRSNLYHARPCLAHAGRSEPGAGGGSQRLPHQTVRCCRSADAVGRRRPADDRVLPGQGTGRRGESRGAGAGNPAGRVVSGRRIVGARGRNCAGEWRRNWSVPRRFCGRPGPHSTLGLPTRPVSCPRPPNGSARSPPSGTRSRTT
jgi:hypothetical protein